MTRGYLMNLKLTLGIAVTTSCWSSHLADRL